MEIEFNGKKVKVYPKIKREQCESSVEFSFIHVLQKWTNCSVKAQVKGNGYRADFVLNDRIVIEIDGKDYHNEITDYIRDQKVLKDFECVIRFNASDAFYSPSLCCYHIIKLYPDLFWDKALEQSKRRSINVEGIFDCKLDTIKARNDGYEKHFYNVKFMPSDNHHKYFFDMESNPGEDIDVFDYCYSKNFIVKHLNEYENPF